jgi:hypothetical protein
METTLKTKRAKHELTKLWLALTAHFERLHT